MFRRTRRKAGGFTLIELLVVIAIIAILIALLVPAVQKVREAAARTQCINNLKQIGVALHAFHDVFKRFPPGCAYDQAPFGPGTGSSWGSSWKVYILPYIEQTAIYNKWQFVSASGYVNGNNQPLVSGVTIGVYRCPSSALPDFYTNMANGGGWNQMFTSYVGISGSTLDSCSSGGAGLVSGGGVLYPNSKVRMNSMTDGTSNTMMVGEQSDHFRAAQTNTPITGSWGAITSQGPHGWTMGGNGDNREPPGYQNGGDNRSFNCVTIRFPINARSNVANTGCHDNTGANIPLSSNHTGGINVLLGDGSVRFLSETTDFVTLQRVASRADGQVVSLN